MLSLTAFQKKIQVEFIIFTFSLKGLGHSSLFFLFDVS